MTTVARFLLYSLAAAAGVTLAAAATFMVFVPQGVSVTSAALRALAEALFVPHGLLPIATLFGCFFATRTQQTMDAVRNGAIAGIVLAFAGWSATPLCLETAGAWRRASFRADASAWMNVVLRERRSLSSDRHRCTWEAVGTDEEGFTVLRGLELRRHDRDRVTQAREATPRLAEDGETLLLTVRDLVHDDLVASSRLDLEFALEGFLEPLTPPTEPAAAWPLLHLVAALVGAAVGSAFHRRRSVRASRADARGG